MSGFLRFVGVGWLEMLLGISVCIHGKMGREERNMERRRRGKRGSECRYDVMNCILGVRNTRLLVFALVHFRWWWWICFDEKRGRRF